VGLLDPLVPRLQAINLLSRRLLWPGFRPEPYLKVADLERALAVSTSDAVLLEQEEIVLRNILALADFRVDELMRPRTQITTYRAPVALADLGEKMPRSGYALVTEGDSDEIAAAVPLRTFAALPANHIERLAEPVVYVPWSTSVAAALDQMRLQDRRVAVVVNELGETLGVVTYEDILDNIFRRSASRSEQLLNRQPIREVTPGVWHVTGMTSLRRLARYFDLHRKPGNTATVAGVMQERLGRFPDVGDECHWAGFRLRALEIPEHGQLLVELCKAPDAAAPESSARKLRPKTAAEPEGSP